MSHIENARKLRPLIEKAVQSLNEEDAIQAVPLYPRWEDLLAAGASFTAEDVEAKFKLQYKDVLYFVVQAHTMQADWTPESAPSLYAKVLIPDETVIPEWVQPDSTNGYSTGDKVTHNEKTWESLVDNNVWEPGAVGTESLWTEVTE